MGNKVKNNKKKTVLVAAIVVVLLVVVLSGGDNKNEPQELQNKYPQVSLATVSELSRGSDITLIGTVESIDEARLEAESSGRITSVSVEIGDTVRAGQTIAQIENSSEYASLLQAEGSYEATLASIAGTDIDAVSTYKSVYITLDSIVRNTVDDQFTRPTTQYPGFKLDSLGQTSELTKERVAVEDILDSLAAIQSSTTIKNVEERLQGLRVDTVRVADFVETLSYIVSRQDITNYFTQSDKDSTEAEFLTARNSLANAIQEIDNALNNIAKSQNSTSSNDAAVKQALGVLKAAQAAYNKTIITTPIAGTVNSVAVKKGDFVNAFNPIAVIANNNALKITAYVNASESERIGQGTVVNIRNIGEGRVSRVAPAIDSATGKIEVQIQTESDQLTNGDVVSLSITPEVEPVTEMSGPIRVPLSALKLTTDKASVFTVENDLLVAHEVTLGDIQSDTAEILDGIDPSWDIVLDARGLSQGQRIQISE